MNKTFWLVGTSRNAILVIVCGFIGYFFCQKGEPPFKVIGEVPPGLPHVMPPPFGFTEENSNGTTVYISLLDMLSDLGSGIVVVPLVGLLENIAICKAFCKYTQLVQLHTMFYVKILANGKAVDATQELLAIGLSNIANSFFQAFPGTGSLSRSAVISSSGVRTTLNGIYTGILVIVALVFCTPYFYFIPKTTLAGIIIAAVIFMVEVKVVKPIWRTKSKIFQRYSYI